MLENLFVDILVDFIASAELMRYLWMRINRPVCWRIQDRINRLLCKKRQHRSSPMESSALTAAKSARLPEEDQLLDFTKERQLEEVERLLSLGVNPNIADQDGCTPIIHAARLRNPEILQLLINNSAVQTINWINCEKQTALMQAARVGCLVTLRILLDAGAEVNVQDHRGYTALMLATFQGQHDAVDALLARGECSLNLQNKWGHSALHEACKKGFLAIVMLLVCCGADIDSKDHWLNPPLIYAALHGHTNVVAYLLRAQCDANAINKASRTALHTAVHNGFCRIVELLLHHGACPDVQDTDGITPLLLAGRHQQEEVSMRLLKAGCNVHLTDRIGKSPLHNAASMGSTVLVDAILQKGVHPDMADQNGNTALVFALRRNHVQVVRHLMQHNCSVKTQLVLGSDCFSVFALALRNGCSELLPLLIEAGCDTSCFLPCQQQARISRVISEDIALMSWLEDSLSNAKTLRSLCRECIRSSLSHRIQDELENLHLPKKFQDFILFK